jgi:hypothetical protein
MVDVFVAVVKAGLLTPARPLHVVPATSANLALRADSMLFDTQNEE